MKTLIKYLQENYDEIQEPILGVFNRKEYVKIISVNLPKVKRDYDGLEKYRSGSALCEYNGIIKKMPVSMITIK